MNRLIKTVFVLSWVLFCQSAVAQDLVAPEPLPVLMSLNIFDQYGITTSVGTISGRSADASLDEIGWELSRFVDNPERRALSDVFDALDFIISAASAEGGRSDCEVFGEISNEVFDYRPPMAIFSLAAEEGLIGPLADPENFALAGRWSLSDPLWVERFRLFREIADNPDASQELAAAALAMLRFEWTLLLDSEVFQAVVNHCERPSSKFVFNGYGNSGGLDDAFSAAWPELTGPHRCSQPDDLAGYRLSFSRFDGNLFPILSAMGVNAFEIICANVEVALPFSELDIVELDGVLIEDMDVSGARIGRLNIENSRAAGAFVLADAEFSGRITMKGFATDGYADLSRIASKGDVLIENSRFGVPNDDGGNSAGGLSFYGADIARQLMLANTVVNGDFSVGTARVDHLRLEGVHVDGTLNLWGSTIHGPAFIGHGDRGIFVKGLVNAFYMRASNIQLNNVYAEGDIQFTNASVVGATYASNVYAGGDIIFRGFRGAEMTLSVVRANKINLRSANISGSAVLSGIKTGLLDGFELGSGYLSVNSWPADRDSDGAALDLDTCLAPFEMPEETQILYGMSLAIYDALELGRLACVERLSLVGANIGGNLDLGGIVLASTDLSSSRIDGQLSLAGDDASYGPRACVIARGMRTDTIIYDLSGALGRPALTDFYGAEYRIMRGSAPGNAFGRDWDSIRVAIGQFLGGTERNCDLVTGVQGDGGDSRATYQPAIYDALAEGFERTGDLDIARRIRIIKNQDYAAALQPTGDGFAERAGVVATRLVYWFADVVSGYGYDNLKAVIWLIGITAFGFLLTALNDLVQSGFFRRVSTLLRRAGHSSRGAAGRASAWIRRTEYAPRPAEAPAVPVVTATEAAPVPFSIGNVVRRTLTGLAFSVDRSIPALELDQDFGRHAHFGLKGVLSGWFYLQRFLSFLIVVLMIAGAFNVFQ